MGKCFSTDSSDLPPENIFPDFFYLCRDIKYLIRISNSTISKLKYEGLKIRRDSCIGHLNDGRIMVGGGTDSSGCLTNKAYLLDPIRSKVTILPSMPILSKEGKFFHYKDFVYLIGAVAECEDEIIANEQSAPIVRYYLLTGQWEVFCDEAEKGLNFKDYVNNTHIGYIERIEDFEIDYKDVLYPGTFMIGSRVYLINGQKITSKGVMEAMETVFSIDLDQEGFDFRIENFKSPSKVFRPVCGSYYKSAFIAGGVDLSQKKCSLSSFLIQFDGDDTKIVEISGLGIGLVGTYPVLGSCNSFIALSFPNLAVYDTTIQKWSQFIIDKQNVQRKLYANPTPLIQTEKIENREILTNKTRIKMGEHLNTSEGVISYRLGLEDEEIDVKLPPGLILDKNVSKTIKAEIKSSRSSNSSNTFSMEKYIPMPQALIGLNISEVKVLDFDSPVSSQKIKKTEGGFQNRPMINNIPPPNPYKHVQDSHVSASSSEILMSLESFPKQIEVDDVVKAKVEIKTLHSRMRSDSVSSSESFGPESSNSSFSSEGRIDAPAKPMVQKMAPIFEKIKVGNSNFYSFSEPDSSESFVYEVGSGEEKQCSSSRRSYKD